MDETTRRSAFEALMTRGHALWCRIRDIAAVLKIIRFSLLVPAVLIVVLVASDQLTDILRAVGEDARRGQIASLLLAAAFEALIVWYTARTMLRFNFESIPASQASVLPNLKRYLPRWLAVLVPTAIGVRVLLLAKGSAYPAAVYVLAAALLAIAVVVGVYVHGRRVLARVHPRLAVLAEQVSTERRDLRSWKDLPRTTRFVIVLLLIANAALMLLYVVRPVAAIGAPAILVLALGLIAVVGSAFVYMGNHYDVPVLVLLLIWVVIISPFNDN
ncbi:MAG TPA: hypothetical protein VHH11_09760, partial [Gammaproteobacteria bacterium]|nr:hypothetical protein [Gammaproteobacteria bacterium]